MHVQFFFPTEHEPTSKTGSSLAVKKIIKHLQDQLNESKKQVIHYENVILEKDTRMKAMEKMQARISEQERTIAELKSKNEQLTNQVVTQTEALKKESQIRKETEKQLNELEERTELSRREHRSLVAGLQDQVKQLQIHSTARVAVLSSLSTQNLSQVAAPVASSGASDDDFQDAVKFMNSGDESTLMANFDAALNAGMGGTGRGAAAQSCALSRSYPTVAMNSRHSNVFSSTSCAQTVVTPLQASSAAPALNPELIDRRASSAFTVSSSNCPAPLPPPRVSTLSRTVQSNTILPMSVRPSAGFFSRPNSSEMPPPGMVMNSTQVPLHSLNGLLSPPAAEPAPVPQVVTRKVTLETVPNG